MYTECFSHILLRPPNKLAHSYHRTPVKGIKGWFGVDVQYQWKGQHIRVCISGNNTPPVFGRNLVTSLGLNFCPVQSSEGCKPEQVGKMADENSEVVTTTPPV